MVGPVYEVDTRHQYGKDFAVSHTEVDSGVLIKKTEHRWDQNGLKDAP